MKKLLLVVVMLLAVLAGATVAHAVPTEFITNGDFETGTLAGWTVTATAGSGFAINDGTFDPPGPHDPEAPIGGSFDVIDFQAGGGTEPLIMQAVVLPTQAIISAILSWDDRIRNNGGFDMTSMDRSGACS